MKLNRVSCPGCDDAPKIRTPRLSDLREPITLVVPYYENPMMLAQQCENWALLDPEIKANLNIIIVDDGSQASPLDWSAVKLPGLDDLRSIRLFRILQDVRWNWLAARNLAMAAADDGWCILTDIDHIVSSLGFRVAMQADLDPGLIYRFSRTDPSGQLLKPHPNSWLMTKAMFWEVGGYDEALSGYYGTDGEYRRRCAATARIRIFETPMMTRWEYHLDSSTTHYKRKQPEDRMVSKLIAKRGPDWTPKTLSFPWAEL